jgi:hypothetical protein
MQRGDHRHVKAAQQGKDVRTGRSPEYSILMLQANQINVAEIQEIRSLSVRGKFILRELEAYARGVKVTFRRIVDR